MRSGIFPVAAWAGRSRRGRFTFEGRPYQLPMNFPPDAIHGTLADRQVGKERRGVGDGSEPGPARLGGCRPRHVDVV